MFGWSFWTSFFEGIPTAIGWFIGSIKSFFVVVGQFFGYLPSYLVFAICIFLCCMFLRFIFGMR